MSKRYEYQYWAPTNNSDVEFTMPREAIEECHHQGACDDDVEYWQEQLNLELPRKPMIHELLEYGAWTVRELCKLTNDELEQKIIWLAAGSIQDDSEHEFNQEKAVPNEQSH